MTQLSNGFLCVPDVVEAILHSSERVGACRIQLGGKGREAEGDGKQEAPEGAGCFSGQMRHSLNPQIIDRAPSLLKGPQCLPHLGGPCLPPYLWFLETTESVVLVT